MDKQILSKAANEARGLSMDAVEACNSGHLGLPLGAAEIGAVLFGHTLQMNPDDPRWINRDRFVLSAGHGSMFLYSWLHLMGYDLTLDDLKSFRKMGSKTPGHPEFGDTPGVECTTGPLGQGVGNAVGMAVSSKMAEAFFNTATNRIFDHHIVCLAGDGCMQEGVSAEASAFAGHFGLDNLILIYDSNDVTLDAMADKTQSEDTAKRYEAYGFDVVTIDGHDMDAFLEAFQKARADDNGKPKLIIAKTEIARSIDEVAGTSKGHGEGGAKYVEAAHKKLGLPSERFSVSVEVKAYFADRKKQLVENYQAWQKTFEAWTTEAPDKAQLLETCISGARPDAETLLESIPEFPADAKLATRAIGGKILTALSGPLPNLLSGSADLHGSTKNYIDDAGDFEKGSFDGRNFRFGIREHGMGAIMNGIAYNGIFIASGATFLTFSDYMRPSIRLAALAKLPLFYIFTHDSIGVGEDGPTHQPVETVSALRCIPGLDVIRPADPEETAGAFAAACARTDGPTALILTRQGVPMLDGPSIDERRTGVLKGAYIAKKETEPLSVIIIATGSEVQHAIEAANKLGNSVRVVSMPSLEIFKRQPAAYQEEVLPNSCRKRVAIEAGVTNTLAAVAGIDGKCIGVDRFGISAPGPEVMKELGITDQTIVDAVKGWEMKCPMGH